MPLSPHPNPTYHLAYITALPSELTAALTLLDTLHGIPQSQPAEDPNAYILGAIGPHNIVMVCLPAGRMGTAAAATVGENLRRTFPGVKYAVLVGIGGGVPRYTEGAESDIRLGDVVVGVPSGGYGGIVSYDCEGRVQLDSPPQKLLGCVTMVNCLMGSARGKRRGEVLGGFWRSWGRGCLACGDAGGEIYRKERTSTLPVVHVGTIASGNTVIGDGVTRDRICERYKGSVLCFEMEAAGLVNCLPCLVVRGISDYADAHKNDEWRPRAIAAAIDSTRMRSIDSLAR
ncbi:purine and uridine phosphorylase [Aspergillus sclerotioniger CBS 115572]|uniref:Purine and uridine phosphorylase n=1 Tax=Aspergillus sclerotioniger CBS 115572 TaxID=1450535 RepID=A0A317XHL3_9EURO|nr:purine and uridine phosphorylase [Aspergillus sclerotioniger CBS 115572]PWY96690.1 purine and uridine phosphorylase [Aspergillus sclerotioniger CBS 115572]